MKREAGFTYEQLSDHDGRLWRAFPSHYPPGPTYTSPQIEAIAERLLRRNSTWEVVCRAASLVLFVGREEIGKVRWENGKYCVAHRDGGVCKRTKDMETAIKAVEMHCYPQPSEEKWHAATVAARNALYAVKNDAYSLCRAISATLYPYIAAAIDSVVAAALAAGDKEAADSAAELIPAYRDVQAGITVTNANTVVLYIAPDGGIYAGGDNPVPLENLPEKVRQGLGFLRLVPDNTVTEFGYRLNETTFIIVQ